MLPDYEKLGAFYLGKTYDLAKRAHTNQIVLYDSKDLVTHAVVVGMTGSGKTGLCITMLEEAAIDAIPAIIIDPKGDLSNLLLTFPNLKPEDFAPWINADDARKKGVEPADFAAQQADLWKKGLADWQQDGDRIQRLRDSADFAIYTPGSNAGLPVSILKSFAAPPAEIANDSELLRERITSTVTSLLGLMNIQADPLQSREHILLSTIFANAWDERRDLDLPALIQAIQNPPVSRVGVMELETFYPARDRFNLAMQLNNLIASPGFARWTAGEPLDINALLHTPAGKPRISIFSIAHLNDAERMFFVSLLLNQTLGWVRTQSGTSSLRAIIYMDEIAGYFPPVANPPSKQPLLTLMKQARAFGVGLVLATQNPVDLDYKGLSNAGTWFIGRLQTERDKARVLDGLEGAAASASAKFDRGQVESALAQLGNRVFLMNNVHDDAPEIIETRWAMSYLRGPLTRDQIRALTDSQRKTGSPAASAARATQPPPAKPTERATPAQSSTRTKSAETSSQRPVLPPEIPQYFIPVRTTPAAAALVYRPLLLGSAKVYFADAKLGVDLEQPAAYVAPIKPGPVSVDWDAAEQTDINETDIEHDPVDGAAFSALPADAGKPKSYDAWKKSFGDMLYRSCRVELLRSGSFKLTSKPNESERDFCARLALAAREERDAAVEKIRERFAPKLATLHERLRRAQQTKAVQEEQATQAKLSTVVSFGSAILSAFFGKKTMSATNVGKAGTAIRGVGRSMKESSDVTRADESVEAVQQQIAEFESQIKTEVDDLSAKPDPAADKLEKLTLKPKKTNISVRTVVLVWAPHELDPTGNATPLWQ